MLSLVPIIFFLITFVIFKRFVTTASWRKSFLAASLIWGGVVTITTEILSFFRFIGFWEILGVWAISSIFALFCIYQINRRCQKRSHAYRTVSISRFNLLLVTGVLFIIIVVGFVGLKSPPNTWDSMSYHMSRVVHWIQGKSIAYYPTHILRQLHQNPWSEFAILHFQILSGSDRISNLIQWFGMVGSILGVSLIAKELGASPRGQIFAGVICATIPMGILQGSSTQNDYVVSFWLVCFTYLAIVLMKNGKVLFALAVGLSLGLAILTKATAYIYAFPFMVWVGLSLIKSFRLRGIWLIGLIIMSILFINWGHYLRNYDLYANPLGPGQEEGYNRKYSNDIFTISSVTSSLIRNIGLHIGTPFEKVNSFLEAEIYNLHEIIGVDINDARTTWAETQFYIGSLSFNEDSAGNPLHLILIITTIPLIVWKQLKQKEIIYYLVCLISAGVLFCLYLKWQPWNSRLHLPLFILWSAIIGLSLSQINFHNVSSFLVVILLLGAIPYTLKNQSRPIIGPDSILITSRTRLYFSKRQSLIDPYTKSAEFILGTQCTDIGLILGDDDWEYPFWVLLHNINRKIHIEHINVTNISKVKSHEYPFNGFTPCTIIVINNNPPNEVNVNNIIYPQKIFINPVSVFMKR